MNPCRLGVRPCPKHFKQSWQFSGLNCQWPTGSMEVWGMWQRYSFQEKAVFDLTKPRALLCLKPLLRLCPRRDVMPSRPFACISYGPATQKKHEFGRDRHQIPDSHTTTTTDDGICPIRPLGTVVPLGRLHVYPYKERM